MRNTGFLYFIMVIMFILDLYVFQIIRSLSQGAAPRIRLAIFSIYWLLSVGALLLLLLMPYLNYDNWPKPLKTYLFATLVGLFFAKLIASLFFLIDCARLNTLVYCGRK